MDSLPVKNLLAVGFVNVLEIWLKKAQDPRNLNKSVTTQRREGGHVEEGDFLQVLSTTVLAWPIMRNWCRFVCAALQVPTSLWPRAAEGLRGGAGRRQLRVHGLLVFGGSRGPRLTALGPPRWDRCVVALTVLSGFPSTFCRRMSKQAYEMYPSAEGSV